MKPALSATINMVADTTTRMIALDKIAYDIEEQAANSDTATYGDDFREVDYHGWKLFGVDAREQLCFTFSKCADDIELFQITGSFLPWEGVMGLARPDNALYLTGDNPDQRSIFTQAQESTTSTANIQSADFETNFNKGKVSYVFLDY